MLSSFFARWRRHNDGNPTRRRRSEARPARNIGRPFAFAMVFVLAFALIYTFVFSLDAYLTPGDNEIIVAFLDVGQGDSILIWSRDHAVLIDGGDVGRQDVILGYMRRAGIRRLDYVIATHPHRDHIGGLVAVLGRVDVGAVIMPDVVHTTETFVNLLAVIENNDLPLVVPEPGQWFRAGIIELEILWPTGTQRNLNDASIVARLQHGETAFLFTGDLEAAGERELIATGQDLRANVLKVGHHGSRTSTTDALLDAVGPVAAVIQVGERNQFGHPHGEVMARLNEHGIAVYRTDVDGTVIMVSDGTQVVLVI